MNEDFCTQHRKSLIYIIFCLDIYVEVYYECVWVDKKMSEAKLIYFTFLKVPQV